MTRYMDRRTFLRGALAAAGALAVPMGNRNGGAAVAAQAGSFSSFDKVTLGKTGINVTRMAVGSGTHGWQKRSNQTKLGMDTFVGMVRHGYERGATFWDMADQYGSHPNFKEALKYVPRDKVTILTKTFTRDAAGVKSDIERFRSEIGTDTIDILLLHCLTDPQWTTKMQATMDVVSEAKEKGIVRACGVSCHHLGALRAAVDSDWVEVILERINHTGASMDGPPEAIAPLLMEARKKGKGVVGMKIAGAGEIRDQIRQSLDYVLPMGCIDAFTMGFESIAEMDDLISKVAATGA